MKKLFTLALVALVSLGANAQLISSNMVTKEKKAGYKKIGINYNSITFGEDSSDDDSTGSISGVALDFLKGFKVSSSMPLYVETGLNVTFGYKSKSEERGGIEAKASFAYLGLKVPVNVTYRYEITDGVRVSPFIGLYLKGNLLGSGKYEIEGHGYDEEETWDVFSKDDMGDDAATRFNVGFGIGANVEYKKLYLGINYSKDFNKFYGYKKAGSMGIFAVSLGLIY